MRYKNRTEAGKTLAARLTEYAGRKDVIVLGLPRGGVPVAYQIARSLGAPLDVFVVRKLGVPGNEELAMGAIASGGVRVLNPDVVDYLNITDEVIDQVVAKERGELERRERLFRGDLLPIDVAGKIVILVDDGLATGSTMRAAVAAIHKQKPLKIVVVAPVAAQTTCQAIEGMTDEVVCECGTTPEPFYAVGLWYEDFAQTTDEEVRELLAKAAKFQTLAPANC